MSIDALWYSSFRGGEPPLCKRLCRMPMWEQWDASIDLAISFAAGEAGWRQVLITRTGEQYWWWCDPRSRSGWWLIPQRIGSRALQLYRDAIAQACQQHCGGSTPLQIATVLRRWKRTAAWRKRAAQIGPRHADPDYWRRPGYLTYRKRQKRDGLSWRLPL